MTPTFFLGTQEQHSWHVQLVLKCLHHNNLFAKLEKCKCDQTNVEFVGYEIALGDELRKVLCEIAAVVGWASLGDIWRTLPLCLSPSLFRIEHTF